MKSLAAKIADVMASVKHPPQSGRHKYHNYSYSTRDDIFGSIRDELASREVAVFPQVLSVERRPTGKQTKNGDEIVCIAVTVSVNLVDSETDERFEQLWQGEAHTDDDKGVQQAVTQALRFWATNTFMLLDGSDEQMYGKPGTQSGSSRGNASSVRRKKATPTPADSATAIRKRLVSLDFEPDQIKLFEAYIAGVEEVDTIGDVHAGRLRLWARRIEDASDEDVRGKVLDAIAGDDEEAA